MSDKKKHSVLAPSAAARWLACPPSALLAEKVGEDKGSVYADEGSLAHHLAELWLRDFIYGRHWMAENPGKDYVSATHNPEAAASLAAAKANPLFYDDMIDEVRVYTSHVVALCDGAGAGIQMEVEAEYPLFYKPDDNGTIDNVIYGGADKTLYITDLKFGRGVRVEAKGNKQLLIYAINAYRKLSKFDIERVVMTIVQPRLDSITSWVLDAADLELEADMIEAGARKALKGEGNFKTGTHCKFCPVKPRCRALADEAVKVAKLDCVDPNVLTNGEIAKLLGRIDVLADWIASVKKYALDRAVAGDHFDGFKLVAGTSRSQISDEKAILSALTAAGYEPSLLKRTSFVTLTELKKVVDKGDFETCCAPYITKPEAPPVLVEASDPRVEYGVAKAATEFKEYMNP